MTGRVVETVRWLIARFKMSLGTEHPTIDLTDEYFFDGLDPRFPTIRRSLRCFDEGEITRARALALSHFRDRESPPFFFTHENLRSLTQEFREHHAIETGQLRSWVERTSMAEFQVYGASAPGLEKGFWDALVPGPGGDVLYPVRPHRYAFAPKLALAHLLGESALALLETVVSGWLTYVSRPGHQHAYISNLVVIYRIIAMHWTLCFLAFGTSPREQALAFDVLKILHHDSRFLAQNFGTSVANNHLLADGFGVWYTFFSFPEFRNSTELKQHGESLFLEELARQFYEDGSGFEQSIHYHELGCEMAVAYLLMNRRARITPSDWVGERVRRMLEFQLALAGPGFVPLPLGDATEDTLFPVSTTDGPDIEALGQFHEFLFSPSKPSGNRSPSSARAFWMLDGFIVEPADSEPTLSEQSQSFPDGGYFVLPDRNGNNRLVLRTGPAPQREVFAGHMHADPLTVYVAVANTPLIVEAGTYTYSSNVTVNDHSWRHYFLGRESHNGLILPGEDPIGRVDENFRPRDVSLRVASTSEGEGKILWRTEGRILGESPYAGYSRGVIHVCNEYWILYDVLPEGRAKSNPTVQFLLAPEVHIAVNGDESLALSAGSGSARLCYTRTRKPTVIKGQLDPLVGWVSPRYGELKAAPSLRFPLDGDQTVAAFVIQPGSDTTLSSLEVEVDDTWLAMRFGSGLDYDVLFSSRSRDCDRDPNISLWNIDFTGCQAWLRVRNGCPISMRWVEGRTMRWLGGVAESTSGDPATLVAELETGNVRVTHGNRESLTVESH